MSALVYRKLRQAQELLQRGDSATARQLCEQALERAPRNPEALCMMGIALLAGGDAARALPPLEQAVTVQKGYGLALEYLGLAFMMLGRFDEAERVLRDATRLPGVPPSAHMRLGISLLNQNRHQDALSALQTALRGAPEDADCRLNLARAYAQSGDPEAARTQLEAILKLDPAHIEARFNLGVLALQRRELDAARQWFEAVIERSPRYVDALVNLGVVLREQSRPDDATRFFHRALEIDPDHAVANKNFADMLFTEGKADEARERYLTVVRSAGNFIEAREGLAVACVALGRFREAVDSLKGMLPVDPSHARAWGVLADAQFQCGELADAESSARQAVALDPSLAAPYSVLALVQIVRGEPGAAIAPLEEGFRQTDSSGLLGMLAHQLRRVCDWEKRRKIWAELKRRLGHEASLGSPFWLLIEETTPEEQLAYTQRWVEGQFGRLGRHESPRRSAVAPAGGERLRIGYFSSEFHEHAIAHLIAGVLEQHDRSRFEVLAYSYGPEDRSPMRARLRAAVEHFIDVAWDPDDLVFQRLRDDRLDLLVDLKGYTMGGRTAVLARRPCAVQVNWLGYPGTMGAPFIDYLITDRFTVPSDSKAAYSEKIVYLDHCWQCNDRTRPVAEPLTREAYGLSAGAFVFCCFAQSVKISPEIFASWMTLLQDVPAAVLWLAEDNRWASDNLRRAAQARGIAPERLVIAPHSSFPQYLARYRVADLALDTFPYTSHSTASDALWAGCPVVGLCGDTFPARVSGSILTHAGLPQLITYSRADYEQLARILATDRNRLAETRSNVVGARASSLFDAESFTRDLERAYLEIRESSRA